jgi:hypothetical protein
MHFASLRVSVLVLSFLLFAASVFTNAFIPIRLSWWNFSSPVYCSPTTCDGEEKKETGRYMYYGLWRKKKKASCSLHRTRDEVALRASWSILCSGWIKRVRRLPGLVQGGFFVQDLIDFGLKAIKTLGIAIWFVQIRWQMCA